MEDSMKKIITKLTALICIVALSCVCLAFLTGCGSKDIVFSGGGKINDVDYNVTLRCNGKNDSFSLKIEEIPTLEINGKYEYDSSKGYRFTFTDANDTIKVPKFDEQTKTFSFEYTLVLGDKYGTGDIKLSLVDEDFVQTAEAYFEPILFYAFDPDVGNYGMTTCEAFMYLYEDGSLSITASCPLTAAYGATGTWSFDKTANQYTFTYDAGGSGMGYMFVDKDPTAWMSYESDKVATYNEETGAYELTIYYNLGLPSTLHMSYNPNN